MSRLQRPALRLLLLLSSVIVGSTEAWSQASAPSGWPNGEGCWVGYQILVPRSYYVTGLYSSLQEREAAADALREWSRFSAIFSNINVYPGNASSKLLNGANEIAAFLTPAETVAEYGVDYAFDSSVFGVAVVSPASSFSGFDECKDYVAGHGGAFIETDVVMNALFDTDWTADWFAPGASNDAQNRAQIFVTALHEVGHTLGLHHVFGLPGKNNSFSCMNYANDDSMRWITRIDANTIRAEYPAAAVALSDAAILPFYYGNDSYAATYATVAPKTAKRGETVAIGPWGIQNVGSTSLSSVIVSFYLLPAGARPFPEPTDLLIGTTDFGAVATNYEVWGFVPQQIPATVPDGSYNIGAIVRVNGAEDSAWVAGKPNNNRFLLGHLAPVVLTVAGSTTSAPTASFTYSPSSPTTGQTIQFTDTSLGSPTSWSWSFGDGTTSAQQNPTKNYSTAGNYTVTLTAANSSGSNATSKTVSVTAAGTAPTASFSWSPTSPTPGQTVQFTDTSTGSPTAWSWNFGDGSTSTTRNPTKAWSVAGNYTVTLTASNSYGSNATSRTVTVASSGTAPTASFSWSPAAPTPGQTVQFTDSSTGSPTAWSWNFGDGTTSTQRNPTKAWSSAGSYSVTLTASNSYGSNATSRTVVVATAGTPGTSQFIAAAAHAAGAGGTFFVTDVRVFNPGASAVTLELRYTPANSDGNSSRILRSAGVAAGETLSLPDIVLNTFGVASGVGSIEVRPIGGEVMATARIYNTAPSGTYGQFISAQPASKGAGSGTTLHILQVEKSSAFRANVGMCEVTGNGVTVTLELWDENGNRLGGKDYTLSAWGMTQVSDIFTALGVSERTNVRVTAKVASGSGKILAYGSIVDNLSTDQIFVPAQPTPTAGGALFIAAGAAASGSNNSTWKTDLRIANLSSSTRTAKVTFLPSDTDNSAATSKSWSLAPGQVKALNNVIAQEFGRTGAGGFLIDTDPPGQIGLVATSRTYNQGATGTFGQFIPAIPSSEAIGAASGKASALAIDRSSSYRANVGFINTTSSSGNATVTLVSGGGQTLGSRGYTLKPYAPLQINDVFTAFGVAFQSNCRVDFEASGSGSILGYASVIDNASNDPIFVTAKPWTSGGTSGQPDLVATTPSGWSGPIVVSTTTGTTTDGSPVGNQPVYIDVALKNTGSVAAGSFIVSLQADGVVKTTWQVTGLAAGAEWKQQDYSLTLGSGSHTLTLVADVYEAVAESNEGNNQATKAMTWGAASCGLYSENFTSSNNTWRFDSHAAWGYQSGMLDVQSIESGWISFAETDFAPGSGFTVDVDLQVLAANGDSSWSVYPWTSSTARFNVAGHLLDGVMVTGWGTGNYFLEGWEPAANNFFTIAGPIYSPGAMSIGVKVTATSLVLRINKADTSLKATGSFSAVSAINGLWLWAYGTATHLRFDNVCATVASQAFLEPVSDHGSDPVTPLNRGFEMPTDLRAAFQRMKESLETAPLAPLE